MSRSAAAYQKFTEDEIRKANSVDILSLARGYGYEPEKAGRKAVHMKHSGGLYIFPENNRFFQWTGPDDGVKGGAIDFVMREENLSFPEAVGKLIGKEFSPSVKQVVPYEKKEREPLVLPEKADNMKRAYWYLVSVRGISPKIVSHFMNRKMIYQEKKYGNCVFVGYDAEGTARYCSMRAARDNSSFKMDATGSDKSYPFFHEGKTDLLIVTEAPIDLMSHASIAADFYGRDWMQDHRISTGCLSLMLNGRGNTYEHKKVDIVLTEQEAEAVGTVVDMELCGHHPPEAEAILNSALEKIDRIAFAKVQTITCHGKDDYSFWSAEIPKDMLHSILHEACERVGTLDELMGAMNPKDGYEMRLFIQTPGRQFAFYRIPERLSNLEDYANEGCSVRGTKDEIMAEIFTEWAPAQEDLEDDFEL